MIQVDFLTEFSILWSMSPF